MSVLVSQFIPPSIPPWYPYIWSLHLSLYFYVANKFIYTIFLDSTCKWYNAMSVFHFLTTLCMRVSMSNHISVNGRTSSPFMAEQYSVVYMYLIFFIHSSVDGHLACFHIMAIVNSIAVNTSIHIPFWFMVFSWFSSVQSLSHVRLFATPWSAAPQASLSITNSWSLPKPMSVESVMPSNHLILCHPLLLLPSIFPNIRVFQMSQLFPSGGQSIGVSASASVLPMNTQDWFPLGWIGWISLRSKGLSRVFSNTTFQKHQFFGTQLSL